MLKFQIALNLNQIVTLEVEKLTFVCFLISLKNMLDS
jgi:hypothetical protein